LTKVQSTSTQAVESEPTAKLQYQHNPTPARWTGTAGTNKVQEQKRSTHECWAQT